MKLRLTFELDLKDVPDDDESARAFAGSLGAAIIRAPLPEQVKGFQLVEVGREMSYFGTLELPNLLEQR